MTILRPMLPTDADAVRRIDVAAFGAYAREVHGEPAALPLRTLANVHACLEMDPEGALVAVAEDRVVGFVFSRTWGGVGWFGPFAVLPGYQGRGIGQRLMAASLSYLRQDSARLIGLETMSDSPYNLELYLKHAFRVIQPSFYLSFRLDRSDTPETELARWSEAGAGAQVRWLDDLRAAAGRIYPGLDYAKEITSLARHDLGETLVLLDGSRAVGFSAVGLTASREGWGGELARVLALALDPVHTSPVTLGELLQGSEALGRAHGKAELVLAANGRHDWALECLLKRGYRVARSMVRMVLRQTAGDLPCDRCVDLSRWAG